MSKFCPFFNKIVLYLDCVECDDKPCKEKDFKHKESFSFIESNEIKEKGGELKYDYNSDL